MTDLTTLTTFLGWCSVINIAILAFTSLMLWLLGGWATRVHGRMFNVDAEHLSALYITWLGNYKLAIIVLNIVPYLALRLMS